MVMTKPELVAALQHEVHLALHLASKVDRAMLDYRPTPAQRSTIELLRYISMMGPTLVEYTITGSQDPELWGRAERAAQARDFDQTVAAIAAQRDEYERQLANVSDAQLRAERPAADGTTKTTIGATLVNLVLCGCAAYRMQLFLYLKSCGRTELSTMNLWIGVDAPATV